MKFPIYFRVIGVFALLWFVLFVCFTFYRINLVIEEPNYVNALFISILPAATIILLLASVCWLFGLKYSFKLLYIVSWLFILIAVIVFWHSKTLKKEYFNHLEIFFSIGFLVSALFIICGIFFKHVKNWAISINEKIKFEHILPSIFTWTIVMLVGPVIIVLLQNFVGKYSIFYPSDIFVQATILKGQPNAMADGKIITQLGVGKSISLDTSSLDLYFIKKINISSLQISYTTTLPTSIIKILFSDGSSIKHTINQNTKNNSYLISFTKRKINWVKIYPLNIVAPKNGHHAPFYFNEFTAKGWVGFFDKENRSRPLPVDDSKEVFEMTYVAKTLDKGDLPEFYKGYFNKKELNDKYYFEQKEQVKLLLKGNKYGKFYGDYNFFYYSVLFECTSLYLKVQGYCNDPIKLLSGNSLFLEQVESVYDEETERYIGGAVFKFVNTEAIVWASKHLIPDPEQLYLGHTFQEVYDIIFKEFAHNMAEAFYYLKFKKDINVEQRDYESQFENEDFNGIDYLETRYGEDLKHIKHSLEEYDVFDGHHAAGFWLRRHIDGSKDVLWLSLQKVLRAYDGGWINEQELKYGQLLRSDTLSSENMKQPE